MYYLRTRAAANAIQFTVDKRLQDEAKAANKAATLVSASAGLVGSSGSSKSLKPLNDISNTKPVAPASVSKDGPPGSAASRSGGPLSPSGLGSAKSSEEAPMSFEEAKRRAEERELEQAKLMCSLENPGACTMCSG